MAPYWKLEGLRRRSLIERGAQGGSVRLQSVVLEYTTERLVAGAAQEIVAAHYELLVGTPLLKATAEDYLRRSQERMIVRPLLERLQSRAGPQATVRHLLAAIAAWRGRPPEAQGYGPGNVVTLLRMLRGNLRDLDLSGLFIRQAYLQEVEAQDASLAGSGLEEAVLAGALSQPASIVLSSDDAYLAVGTFTGEVCVWRVADRALVLTLEAHTGTVLGVAFGEDGRVLASSRV